MMLRKTAPIVLIFGFLAADVQPAAGESCFEGRRDCSGFWITEFGCAFRMNDAPDPRKESFYFNWDVGYMRNTKRNWALGGGVFIGADDYGSRLAVKGRVRRWLTRRISLDASPGILFAINDRYGAAPPGFTGHLGLNFREWFQLVAMTEVINVRPDPERYPNIPPGTDVSWYLGGKAGGYMGFAGSAVLVGIVVIAVATMGPLVSFSY